MTRQDWLTAGMVAAGVAALVVALMAPPLCWAEQAARLAVPALPPAELTIPSIQGKVSASTTPAPGEAVKVTLTLTSSAGSNVPKVPVTVTVLSTTMSMMRRSLPMPEQVTQVEASVPVGADGKGLAVVELPLIWAAPPPPPPAATPGNTEATKKAFSEQVTTSYQIVLSSPLGGQATPAGRLSRGIRTPDAVPANGK